MGIATQDNDPIDHVFLEYDLSMDKLVKIVYRLGLAVIWLVALYWFAMGVIFLLADGYGSNPFLFLFLSAPIGGVIAHLLLRWILVTYPNKHY